MENSYNIAHVRGTGYLCKTHLPSNTAFRGFGGPQGMMITESWMDDVAMSLGLSSERVGTHTHLHTQNDIYCQQTHRLTHPHNDI